MNIGNNNNFYFSFFQNKSVYQRKDFLETIRLLKHYQNFIYTDFYFLNFTKKLKFVGSKNKLKRFKENETFQNVFQPTREEVVGGAFPLKGKWNQDFFKNEHPIIIELGCGKGEYSVGLAERYPDKNFVGIDI